MTGSAGLAVHGLRARIEGWPEVVESLRLDFAWFAGPAPAGPVAAEVRVERGAPDFDAFGALDASFVTPRNVVYQDGGRTIVDYFGRAVSVLDRGPVARLTVQGEDEHLVHEAAYHFLLSRSASTSTAPGCRACTRWRSAAAQGAVAVMLPSGGGKSTLALRALRERRRCGCCRRTPRCMDRRGAPAPVPAADRHQRHRRGDAARGKRPPDRADGVPPQARARGRRVRRPHRARAAAAAPHRHRAALAGAGGAAGARCAAAGAVIPLLREAVVGVGVYQGMEFVLQHGMRDVVRHGPAGVTRTRASAALLARASVWRLTLGRDHDAQLGGARPAARGPVSRLGFPLWAVLAVLCLLVAVGRPASFAAPPSRDMGQYMYVGTVVLEGGTPYVDAANNKGPANQLLWAGVRAVSGRSPLAPRLVLVLATALGALALALWVAGHLGRAAGLLAGGIYALLSSADGFEAYDPNNAQFGTPVMLAAVALAAVPRRAPAALAGAAAAFAFWMNPAFAFAAPFVAWQLWAAGPARAGRLAAAALGALAVSAVLVAWVGAGGGLDDMAIQVFGQAERALSPDVTASATPPPTVGAAPLQFLLDLPESTLWIAGLVAAMVAARSRAHRVLALACVLWLLAWFTRVEIASYAFPNQYVPALAGIAAALAIAIASLWGGPRRDRVALSALVVAPLAWLAVAAPQLTSLGIPADERGRVGAEEAAAFVRANTAPGETLAVAGYDPQIQWLADRRSPSRFFDSFGLSNRDAYVDERRRALRERPPAAVVALIDTLLDPDLDALVREEGYRLAYERPTGRVWLRP